MNAEKWIDWLLKSFLEVLIGTLMGALGSVLLALFPVLSSANQAFLAFGVLLVLIVLIRWLYYRK